MQSQNPEEQGMENRGFRFWDYLALLIKWRKLILLNFIVVCVAAVVLSLILPKWYNAETTLMPPAEQQSMGFGLASVLSELPFGEFAMPGMRSPSEIFKAILESRTVAVALVEKLNLMEVYKKKRLEDAIGTLWEHSQITMTEEGLIRISVEERSPELAAQIANQYVAELDRTNQMASVSRAKNMRIFVEERLQETQVNLQKAEDSLRLFQEENRAVSLPDQILASIQTAAELEAQKIALEVEQGVLFKSVNRTHPRIIQLQTEIDELQKQIDYIARGYPNRMTTQQEQTDQTISEGTLDIPLRDIPAVGLKLARLTREVKIQEAVFELLTQQYEQAKIQEAKDTPTVQVLDKAVPPEIRSKPMRKRIVIFAGGLSIFMSVLLVIWLEYINALREKHNEEYLKVRGLQRELAADIGFVLRKIGLKRKIH